MKKSKITGITQKAKNSVDKSESSINRFARFMGVMTKSVTKDIPDQKTLKKAGLFAKNFGGGRSSKVNKMLLGGALMLPLVLGQMMSKERSTEELLQNQYGGNEKEMQSDLNEEQKIRDEGLEKVETTADENKDISLDRKKDLQAVSQKDPEEIPKSEVDSDDTTLERMNDRLSSVDEGIDKKSSDQFVKLMDRFVFLAKVGAFSAEDRGLTLSDRIDQLKGNIRKFTGGKIDDGQFSLGFGINIPNVFSEKGRQKLGLGSNDNSKDQQSRIQEINDSVDAQIAKNEKAYADAGALAANEEATNKYLRTKTELEKLKKRLQDEPLTVLTEMMSDANPSSVSSQTSMLSVGGGGTGVGTKEQRAMIDAISMAEGTTGSYGTIYGGAVVPELARGELTLDEVLEMQRTGMVRGRNVGYAVDEHNSDATGRHQFMSYTLREEMQKQGISGDTLFTPELQDQMILSRISRFRGVTPELLAKEGMSDKVIDMLAPEFASFPNLFGPDNKGRVGTNSSYYGQGGKSAQSIRDAFNKSLNTSDPMGDQSSITPNNPNQIAQFVPEKYMPYDDPSKSSEPIIALAPTPVNTGQQPTVTGSDNGGSPEVIPVSDTGALFSQIQLNSLALT